MITPDPSEWTQPVPFFARRSEKIHEELIEQIAADPARRIGVAHLDDFFSADVDDAREDLFHDLDDGCAAVRDRRRCLNPQARE